MSMSTIFTIAAVAFGLFAFVTRLGYPAGYEPKEFRRKSRNRRKGLDGRIGGRREEDKVLEGRRRLRLSL